MTSTEIIFYFKLVFGYWSKTQQWYNNYRFETNNSHSPKGMNNLFNRVVQTCVPSNFMANRQVPEFSLNNCAQSSKKMFMCPSIKVYQMSYFHKFVKFSKATFTILPKLICPCYNKSPIRWKKSA